MGDEIPFFKVREVIKIYNGLGVMKFLYCSHHYVKIAKNLIDISFYTDFQSLYTRLKDNNMITTSILSNYTMVIGYLFKMD